MDNTQGKGRWMFTSFLLAAFMRQPGQSWFLWPAANVRFLRSRKVKSFPNYFLLGLPNPQDHFEDDPSADLLSLKTGSKGNSKNERNKRVHKTLVWPVERLAALGWLCLNLKAKQGQTSLEPGWETTRCARLNAQFELQENISEEKTSPLQNYQIASK